MIDHSNHHKDAYDSLKNQQASFANRASTAHKGVHMNKQIKRLVAFGKAHHLFSEEDEIYVRNQILECLGIHDYEEEEIEEETLSSPQSILDELLDYAIDKGLIEDTIVSRDLLDTKLMNCMMPRPSEVISTFQQHYAHSPKEATDYYYDLSRASNYMRTDRIAKDLHWVTDTKYGSIDITINLSKPEKDPKDIAKAKLLPPSKYPKCLLCKENEGYAGTISHPARHNHRIIPITLHNTKYFLQYSPYSYYNEHCIVFNEQHIPMVINEDTLHCLLDFVEQFPHYFLGSNADLPIVGGSILTHDHFQGGSYSFAMERAPMIEEVVSTAYPEVSYGRVVWPLSVLRLRSKNKEALIQLATEVLAKWRTYDDEHVDILAFSKEVPHNTITPIARMRGEYFELDLTLRNNRTTQEYPSGIFHPHEALHHIKKENIGLIEVMGLAVLPARLKTELAQIEDCLVQQLPLPEELSTHLTWYSHLCETYKGISQEELHHALEEEVGHIFEQVLEDAGVFKQDEVGQAAFLRFMNSIEVN